jgi:hypothetical protein
VEARVVDARGKTLFREKRTCNIEADCAVQPFITKERFNHTKGFTVPDKAAFGTYEIQIKVWNKTGKFIAHNEQEIKVVPKK